MWREFLLAVIAIFGLAAEAAEDRTNIECHGQFVQAGLIVCKAKAGASVSLEALNGADRRSVIADENGLATFGLKRTEAETIQVVVDGSEASPATYTIAKRDDPFRTIKGLDCDKVDARTPEQKEHAGQSWVKKVEAFKSFNEGPGALTGFLRPSDGPPSSPFGPARKYIGVGKDGEPCEKTSIHRGYDIAIPTGTPILAPAAGTVVLADPDLYYEGGTVFLDHGAGLVSVFMHLSSVDVAVGDAVEAGEFLGQSGNTGRTTGPHLHWAVKWRNQNSDDRRKDFYIDPALLLDLWSDEAPFSD